MPTHYTQWIDNKIVGRNGQRYELRINCGNNIYDWDVSHPTDSIILDKLRIIDFGKTRWSRFDEDGDLVAAERTFRIRDQYKFSGKDGSGTPIAEVNLATSKTSLLPFIFNDNSGNTTYHVWLSQLNPDGSLKEIYFYGQFQINLIDGTVFQITNPMTANEMKLQTKTLKAVTMSDVLKAHTIQELVSGSRTNGVPDGLVAGFNASDIFTIGGFNTSRKAWFAGLVARKGRDNGSGIFAQGSNIQANANAADFELCEYVGQCSNLSKIPFGWGNNMYGMPDGYQGLSYTTVINKMSQICGFTFSSSDSDNPFAQYAPSFVLDGGIYDRYNLSQITDPHLLDVIAINYNIRFGVKPNIPNQLHYGHNDDDGSFQKVNITAAAGTSPTILTLSSDIEMIPGISGQRIIIKHSPYASTDAAEVFYMTVIDGTHISLQDSTGANVSWTYVANCQLHFANAAYWDQSNPATFDRGKNFGDMLKIICFRFGYMIDWDIWQSGGSKGLPKLILRNMLKTAGSLPSKWKQSIQPKLLAGTRIETRTLPKKNIHIKYAGDSAGLYCPTRFGESIEIEIHGRLKQWGRKKFSLQSAFINDTGEDIFSQWNTHYRCGIDEHVVDSSGNVFDNPSTTSDKGWILGAHDFYYFDNPSPLFYNSHFTLGDAGTVHTNLLDWSGFYALSYEDYGTGSGLDWDARGFSNTATIHDGVNTVDNRFNSLTRKAVFYANVFLNSNVTEKRSFSTAKDDNGFIRTLRPLLADSWQDEDGVVRSHLLHAIELDDLLDISDCEFTIAPPDYNTLTEYQVFIEPGNGANTGGLGGGGGFNGNDAGTDNDLAKFPSIDSRNDTIPIADNITGLRIKGHSLTQSANLEEHGTWDGTTYTLKSGVAPLGGFFAALQNGFVLKNSGGTRSEIQFNNPANTFHVGLRASTTAITANTIWALPSADGTSGQFLGTDGSGNLGWYTGSLTAAVILAPTTAFRNKIVTQNNSTTGLEVWTGSGITSDLFNLIDAASSVQVGVDYTGAMRLNQLLTATDGITVGGLPVTITTGGTGSNGLIVNGVASQSAPLIKAVNSSAQGIFSVESHGGITFQLRTDDTMISYFQIASATANIIDIQNFGGTVITRLDASHKLNVGGVLSAATSVMAGSTASPSTVLQSAGDFSVVTHAVALTTTNGRNDNLAIGAFSTIRITNATANFSISGFASPQNGKELSVFNDTAFNMTINNQDANSTAANRIITLSGGNEATVGTGCAQFYYDSNNSRWILRSIKA